MRVFPFLLFLRGFAERSGEYPHVRVAIRHRRLSASQLGDSIDGDQSLEARADDPFAGECEFAYSSREFARKPHYGDPQLQSQQDSRRGTPRALVERDLSPGVRRGRSSRAAGRRYPRRFPRCQRLEPRGGAGTPATVPGRMPGLGRISYAGRHDDRSIVELDGYGRVHRHKRWHEWRRVHPHV